VSDTESNNVNATIKRVLDDCGNDVTILVCGSFFFMGDAKRAILDYSTGGKKATET